MKQVGSPSPYKASEAYRHPRLRRCFRTISLVDFSPNRYGLGFFPHKKGGPRWLDGWPRLHPSLSSLHVSFSGSWVGWVVHSKEVGLPFGSFHVCFLGSWVGWVGRGWAPIQLPLLGWLGRPSWVGWVGRCQQAGLPLNSLHVSFFLGSWVGWVGRGQEAGLALGSLHIAFLGSWVGWVVRGQEAGLALGSIHTGFLGSWVGWVVRGQEAGLPLGSLHVSFLLGPGSDGWAAAKKLGSHWVPFIFPFWAPGSDGWSTAKKLGFRWAPCMFRSFWAPGSDGWAAAKKLGSHWVPFIFPFWAPGSDGWSAAKKLGSRWAPLMFLSFWAPGSDGPGGFRTYDQCHGCKNREHVLYNFERCTNKTFRTRRSFSKKRTLPCRADVITAHTSSAQKYNLT